MHETSTDPRIAGWRTRLALRSAQAIDRLSEVPGVVGLILGGSVGRAEHWPLSDIDVIVISSGRPIDEVAVDVDRRAYELSEMWGSAGIYTAVDAGRLIFDAAEVEVADEGGPPPGDRWFHGVDKMYGGRALHDPTGVATALLGVSSRWRFHPMVSRARVVRWLAASQDALAAAERIGPADGIGAWVAIRRAATAVAEASTEQWGERSGSFGRFWSRFERRASEHGEKQLADELTAAADAGPRTFQDLPEWLAERIVLSFDARRHIGEPVSWDANARDNVLAFATLYRDRFPAAADAWLQPPADADVPAAVSSLKRLARARMALQPPQ